jgi:hypothetical protein
MTDVKPGDRVYFQSYFQPDLIPGTVVKVTKKKVYIEHGDITPYRTDPNDVYPWTQEREDLAHRIRALEEEAVRLRAEMRK